jgi:hypothetical protein
MYTYMNDEAKAIRKVGAVLVVQPTSPSAHLAHRLPRFHRYCSWKNGQLFREHALRRAASCSGHSCSGHLASNQESHFPYD